jgi:hypothetical protein
MPQSLSQEKKLEWEEKIRQQSKSGLSIERWCRQNEIAAHMFHYWKGRLFPKPQLTRSCFTELTSHQSTGISIEYKDFRIQVNKCFDPATLRNCLLALRELKC